MKRSGRLRPVSAKRERWLKLYREHCIKLGPRQVCRGCEIFIEIGLTGDWHHPAGRRTLEDLLNVMPLCRGCHDWCHRFPSSAMEAGLLDRRYRRTD